MFDPIAQVDREPMTFGEAAINLTKAGVFDPSVCTNFGSAFVKSRASDSFPASMKDFIAPIKVDVSNCSIITIITQTDPPDATGSFDYVVKEESGRDLEANSVDDSTVTYIEEEGTYTISGAVLIEAVYVEGSCWSLHMT